MSGMKLVAVILIVAGVLALAYGGFSYTKKSSGAKIGPIELNFKEKERVNIPEWAGGGAVLVGAAMLLLAGRKR